MRTISEAAAYIKSNDPETAFTQTALRRMVKSGELPSVKIGAKFLVNLDTVLDYLQNPVPRSVVKIPENIIRPIPEKISSGEYVRKR